MNSTPVSLLERLRREPDAQAWRRLVDLYTPWLHGQFRSHGLQTADVDDLVQEVMTVLTREVPNFRHNGQRGAFRTWLRGIVTNRLRELWRARNRQPALGGSDYEKTLDQLTDDQSRLSRLWDHEHDQHVVHQLLKMIAADFSPSTWQAFRAFVLQGRTAAAVAVELGISEGAVWTAKSHVLKRLRQVAKDWVD
ncbi:MAG TPA: sigma-70 family RNA polymerase sigma factor [Pirellulales bacterium]|nr:sigma-70 family RNA polymerase sigma factor [Pirellulales bacterium]